MWTMGYNDAGDFNMSDSFINGRKLRPLIPRPAPCSNNPSTTNPPCLSRIHGTDFFALNHHLASMADLNRREFNAQPVVVSSRWNPTPEQLRTLEELYRRGTRTPSAEQIQHITAQLRRYGKIEGKNVFYWFQNHKARERQKRRRQMESAPDEHNRDAETLERKDSGASRTSYEVEQTRNWAPSTNCSTQSEESMAAMPRATKAPMAECRPEGWIQFGEGELQQRRSFMERNASWQMMQLSCAPPHVINTTTTTVATTISGTANTTTSAAPTPAAITMMDPKLIKAHDLNIFIAPYREHARALNYLSSRVNNEEDDCGESQTLQLFPLRSEDSNGTMNEKDSEISVAEAMNDNFTNSYQFFEFLPLKN